MLPNQRTQLKLVSQLPLSINITEVQVVSHCRILGVEITIDTLKDIADFIAEALGFCSEPGDNIDWNRSW